MLHIYIAFYAHIFIAKVIKKEKVIFNADIYDTLYSKMYFIYVRNIYICIYIYIYIHARAYVVCVGVYTIYN